MYNPPKPEDLVDALQDPIHADIGNSRPAYTVRMLKNLRNAETNESVNSLSINAEIENGDIDFSLEAEHTFSDKLGKLTVTIDDDKTVSAKLKVEF